MTLISELNVNCRDSYIGLKYRILLWESGADLYRDMSQKELGHRDPGFLFGNTFTILTAVTKCYLLLTQYFPPSAILINIEHREINNCTQEHLPVSLWLPNNRPLLVITVIERWQGRKLDTCCVRFYQYLILDDIDFIWVNFNTVDKRLSWDLSSHGPRFSYSA